MISVKNLKKSYGDVHAVKGIDLEVHRGEVFGFLGPNGAGKTTTINMLLGNTYPDDGSIDIDLSDGIHHGIGYLPSDEYLFRSYTARQLFVYYQKFVEVDQDHLQKLIDTFEVEMDRPVEELSRGNQRKVSIVLAFMHQPDLYVLDEPTTGLDPLLQKRFHELIEEEKARDATVFLSSHVLSEVETIVDRIALIKEGEIAEVDSVDNVLQNTHLKVDFTLRKRALQKDINPILKDAVISGRSVSGTYGGDINTLLSKLSKLELESLTITKPTLEEIFLTRYSS